MTESDNGLLEFLERAEKALGRNEQTKALGILVDIRESGFVSRELDRQIDFLRSPDPDMETCRAWTRDAIDRVSAFGGDIFRDLEDLGEQSLGIEAGSWVAIEGDEDDDFDLFDDESFADAIALAAPSEGLEEVSLGTRLKGASGKFQLPSPPSESSAKTSEPSNSNSEDLRATGKHQAPEGLLEQETSVRDSAEKSDPLTSEAPSIEDSLDFQFDDAFEDIAEESDLRELTPLRGIESVDRHSPPEDEPKPIRRQGFDSGVSQARYAGVEPPPPRHRMRGDAGAEPAAGLDFSFDDSEPEQDDEFDFDLGLDNPNARPFGMSQPTTAGKSAVQDDDDDDDFDFDLGLETPGNTFSAPPNRSLKQTPGRGLQATPMGQVLDEKSDPLPEDEFFMLAEELASEAELVNNSTRQPRNDFVHSAPTGTAHEAIEDSFVLEEASAGDSAPVGTATNLSAILLEARRMFQQGDLNAALNVCDKVISRDKTDQEALELKGEIEKSLEGVRLTRLGSLESIPTLVVKMADLAGMSLDHRAGYLLSQLDGMMAIEDLLEISSMSRYETLSLLVDLLERGVIEL